MGRATSDSNATMGPIFFGMSGMRERVALLGGNFQVESRTEAPKKGTKISIELPIAK